MAQINKPTDYFNTVLYSGTGSSNSVTGVGFQPDWTWIKSRNNTRNHNVYDSVRGTTKVIYTDLADAESTQASGLTAFNSDGFTVVSDLGVNGASDNYASWNWLAGGTASSNTDGTITSSVSANQTAGFSVATWTGAGAAGTVGHGLGKAPEFVITKKRNNAGNWNCYHASLGSTKYIYLNSANASATNSGRWNDTDPTSSVMSLGTDDNLTGNGDNIIGYFFTSIKGYSKVGQYSGNSNTDGSMLYLGFKPSFIIIKDITSTDPWHIIDAKRNTVNVMNARLFPNTSGAESTSTNICDFLSTGIKFRGTNDGFNGSRTYIYMAIAEQPLVGTNNIPATAR